MSRGSFTSLLEAETIKDSWSRSGQIQRTEWKTLKTGCSSPPPCSGHRQRQKSLGAEAAVEKEELGKGRMIGSKRLITGVGHGAICPGYCRQVIRGRAYEPTPWGVIWGKQRATGCSVFCFHIICDLTNLDPELPLIMSLSKDEGSWSAEMSSWPGLALFLSYFCSHL